ncbi:hypothetical protein R3P38DRAFT_3258921 [Favolaschia claudopus]|uniref:C2H2-type domain-containing protein n=1 Tax=Favolaschia claudopus TaxID=2862362 RepID=A0AAW0D1J9_9AGAR
MARLVVLLSPYPLYPMHTVHPLRHPFFSLSHPVPIFASIDSSPALSNSSPQAPPSPVRIRHQPPFPGSAFEPIDPIQMSPISATFQVASAPSSQTMGSNTTPPYPPDWPPSHLPTLPSFPNSNTLPFQSPAASRGSFPPSPVSPSRPAPSLRLPVVPPHPDFNFAYMNPSFPAHPGSVNYRELALSLSDNEEDDSDYPPQAMNQRDGIPGASMEPQSMVLDNDPDGEYESDSGPSTPDSGTASPPIVIETIPSAVERKQRRERKPDKMHPCSICNKEFPRPSALETHMNSHTNSRPYPCEYPTCPKTFSVHSNARRHYRTHIEKTMRRAQMAEFPPRFQFAERIDLPPQPPPPPLSMSSAPYRVRWVGTNATTRNMKPTVPQQSKKRGGKKPTGQEHEQSEEEAPIVLYDPFTNNDTPHA